MLEKKDEETFLRDSAVMPWKVIEKYFVLILALI